MGCSSDKNALTKSIKYSSKSSNSKTHNDKSIISFDINAVSLDLSNNLNIYNNFIRFCEKNSFPKLTYLNLSNNNLEDLSDLRALIAPKLEQLDLSYNKLQNIDILKELNFALKNINLEGNYSLSIKADDPFFENINLGIDKDNSAIIKQQLNDAEENSSIII